MHLFSWLLILLVPALTPVWLLFLVRRRRRQLVWLEQHGRRVRALVVGVKDTHFSDRWQRRACLLATFAHAGTGRGDEQWKSSCVLIAQWRDPHTQQSYTFTSGLLRSPRRHYPPGSTVRVVIDPHSPRRYSMDRLAVKQQETDDFCDKGSRKGVSREDERRSRTQATANI